MDRFSVRTLSTLGTRCLYVVMMCAFVLCLWVCSSAGTFPRCVIILWAFLVLLLRLVASMQDLIVVTVLYVSYYTIVLTLRAVRRLRVL